MQEGGSCLRRTGTKTQKYAVIKLEGDQVSIGSSKLATFTISSSLISPHHALIRQSGNSWTIMDTTSTNGTFVNGHRLDANKPHILQGGDMVQFGIHTSGRSPLFLYQFIHPPMVPEESRENLEAPRLEESAGLQEVGENQVPLNLQQEWEEALEGKNKIAEMVKDFKEQLQDCRQVLEMILKKKEEELTQLTSKMNEAKEESDTVKQQIVKMNVDMQSGFMDLMEVKLQCTICREYFIQATSVNCTHVFCKLCISQWMRVKEECPNCRKPIISQIQIPALDVCIDKMVDQLDDNMKKQRAEIVNQRKIEQERFNRTVRAASDMRTTLMRARNQGSALLAVLIRAATQTRAVGYTGALTLRRMAALHGAEVRAGAAEVRRAAERQGAEALVKMATLKRAVAHKAAEAIKKAAVLKREEARTRSAVMKKTALLMRAATRRGKRCFMRAAKFTEVDALTEMANLKKAAAKLAKRAACSGTTFLKSSAFFRETATAVRTMAQEGSHLFGETLAMKMASVMKRAVFAKAVVLEKAKAVRKAAAVIKTAVLLKAAEIKRKAAVIRAAATTKVASLTETFTGRISSTRAAAFSMTQRFGAVQVTPVSEATTVAVNASTMVTRKAIQLLDDVSLLLRSDWSNRENSFTCGVWSMMYVTSSAVDVIQQVQNRCSIILMID